MVVNVPRHLQGLRRKKEEENNGEEDEENLDTTTTHLLNCLQCLALCVVLIRPDQPPPFIVIRSYHLCFKSMGTNCRRFLQPPSSICGPYMTTFWYTSTPGIRRQPCMKTRFGYVDTMINHIFSTASVMDRGL